MARFERSRALPMDRPKKQESVWKISKVFLLGFLVGETFLLLLITSITSLR